MRKGFILIILLLNFSFCSYAQQYALFNTKTLFDAFENPAQSSFILDSSRQFASNFLFPYLELNGLNKGNSSATIKDLVNSGYQQNRIGRFAHPKTLQENSNIYLMAFRLFKYHRFSAEMGFSWQIKINSSIYYDKEISRGLFQETLNNFGTLSKANIFNNNGKLQAYHQMSFTYRENYNKQWAWGVKASLLSGLGYTDFYADKSIVKINRQTGQMDIDMSGKYHLNYPDNAYYTVKDILPFRNLGASVGVGVSYTSKTGVLMMANLKDLGFIRWNKKSYYSDFDESKTLTDITGNDAGKNMKNAMDNMGRSSKVQKYFTSTIDTRADFLLSKTFGSYTPNLIISKNIFDNYGDIALVNTLKSGIFSFSIVPTYQMDNTFKLGMQGMIKSPNFELFMGTNDIIKSYYATKEIIGQTQSQATGYNRASLYLGMAIKIGYVVEHPQNMSWMPGIGRGLEKQGLFRKIFGIFKKKNKENL